MRHATCSWIVLCFAGAVPAQIGPGHAVVATAVTGTPATVLLDVDLSTGGVQPLGRFPSDHLPPLAVAVDDLDRELLLVVDTGATSRLLRLHLAGSTIAGERVLGDVAGRVTQVAVESGGDCLLAVTGASGGLVRLPRWGGPPAPVLAAAWTTALSDTRQTLAHAAIAQAGADGPPVRDAQVGVLVLPSSAYTIGPTVLTGYRPRAITGIVDLPTGLVRHALAHDDGTISLFELGIGTRPLGVTPVLPAGATIAMKDGPNAYDPIVLGNAAHPFLKTFSAFGAPAVWRTLAGPFPGDPVDFDLAPAGGARAEPFARACGTLVPLQVSWSGPPRLGGPTFQLSLSRAVPQLPAGLVLGASDQRHGATPLPVPLPGGCSLFVSVDLAFTTTADAGGNATQPLPIPADPVLNGLLLYGEWVQLVSGALVTSEGIALELGF